MTRHRLGLIAWGVWFCYLDYRVVYHHERQALFLMILVPAAYLMGFGWRE